MMVLPVEKTQQQKQNEKQEKKRSTFS